MLDVLKQKIGHTPSYVHLLSIMQHLLLLPGKKPFNNFSFGLLLIVDAGGHTTNVDHLLCKIIKNCEMRETLNFIIHVLYL